MKKTHNKFLRRRCYAVLAAVLVTASGCDLFVSVEAHVARGEKAAAESNFGLAAVEYRNALHSKPDYLAARLKLVDVLLRAGDVTGAAVELEPALQSASTSGEAQDLSARLQLARGEGKGLLEALDSGRTNLSGARKPLRRGQALLSMGRVDEAAAAFADVLKIEPGSEEGRIGQVQAFAAAGDVKKAIHELDVLLQAKPQLARGWLVRGYLLARGGQETDAESAFLKAKKFANGQLNLAEKVGLLRVLADVQLARDDVDSARATVNEMIAIAPNASATILADAQVDLAGGKRADAISKLQKLSTALPELFPARFLLARALVAQNTLEQADSLLSQLVAEAPKSIAVRKLSAEVKLRLDSPADALETLSSIAAGPTDDGELINLLATAVSHAGKSPAAVARLETDQKRNPADQQLRWLLARVYLVSGQAPKAVGLLREDKDIEHDARSVGLLLAAVVSAQGLSVARAESGRLAAANSDNLRVLNAITEFLISQREFGPAKEVLSHALSREPQSIPLLFTQARLGLAANEPDAAAAGLREILAVDPANMTAYMQLAQLALRGQDVTEITRLLATACTQNTSAVEPRLILVEVYLKSGQFERADLLAKEIAVIAAGHAGVMNTLGELQLQASRFPQSLDAFQRASKSQPANALYWVNVARAQLALKNFAAAREAVTQSLKLKPDELGALRLASLIEIKAGNPQAGLQRALTYKREHAVLPAALLLEGDVRMELQQYKEASVAYEEALKNAPDGGLAIQAFRARSLAKLSDETLPLERWLEAHPDDASVRNVLAQGYQAAGNRPRAIAEYERILSVRADDVAARNNLAWLYHESKDGRAESTAKAAYQQATTVPSVGDTYGWILLDRGKVAEGLKILTEAASKAPRQPDIQYHYAVALARTGATAEAQKLLTAVLRDFPSFGSRAEAQQALDKLTEGMRSPS